MKEVRGNLWTYPADVRVITTNGTVKKNGECVMGRGCAAEAKSRFHKIAANLGCQITIAGNHVHDLGKYDGIRIVSFPVKYNWYEKADITLILRSVNELVDMLDPLYPNDNGHVIVLPRPGCGNGGLKWENVKPVLAPILDDRFHVITF